MNNVNMGGMNAMGGPVGGGMPMMNNGAPGGGIRQPVPLTERSQLNTYIYDYFLRNGMYDVARALLQSDCGVKVIKDSPGRRRDDDGNEEDNDSKDSLDAKRPDDLPQSDVPRECPESCFLYEWWCLFWDMFNAQRGKGQGQNVLNYVNHTNAQSRMRQDQQQQMLRGINNRDGMGGMQQGQYQQMLRMNQANANGMNLNGNELRQKAIQNNRNATPQQQMMLAKQQQQQAMQRDPSSGDHQQRAGSPNSAENAPSPSKRPRIDGGGNFNPQQQMPNGRGQPMPQQVGDSGPSNAIQAAHMQLANGIDPHNLTAQQFQNMPANAQARTVAGYQAGLAQQQATQMPGKGMPNAGGLANQGSPMMNQGQDGTAIAGYYNAGEMGTQARMGQPGQQAAGGGNHALQDYQMQLMLLEQQNKKRLMMARQEQDSMAIPGQGRDGSGGPGMGPAGQPFQQGTSPQGARSVNSPNPSDQMKRGTPHMNPAGIPSPMPEGQSRGSPSNMGFIPGPPMDPNMNPQYFMKNNMDPNMVNAMPNGMRPPSSHPAGGFNAQGMAPNQMTMAQQAQRQQSVTGAWPGQNGMMPGQAQGPQQGMGQGTPQQRPMAPPAAPVVANGRTQTSSPQQNAAPPTPQQSNKAKPNKKTETKDAKAKRATKKGTTATTGATPSAESVQEPATPTPATPITPVHPKSFNNGQNGAVQPVTNGQPQNAMNGIPQPDPLQNNFDMGGGAFDLNGFQFADSTSNDVLQDFDFDSFLHQDGDVNDQFNFGDTSFLDGGEIGAE